MPSFNLASTRMSTGGSPGGLSPVLIDGSAGSRKAAPQINPHAADVRYAEMAAPAIVVDTTISDAARHGATMVQSAMDLSARKAEAQASQGLLDLEDQLTQYVYGKDGLFNRTGQAAVNSYQDSVEYIKQMTADALAQAEPAVRANMVLASHKLTSDILSKASIHVARQQAEWESEIQNNRLVRDRNQMLQASKNPTEFQAQLNETLSAIDEYFPGQLELAEKAKRELKVDAYLSAAEQQSALKNFALAAEYVVRGGKDGVDQLASAKMLQKIERDMLANNSRIAVRESREAAQNKLDREVANHNALNEALKSRSRAPVDSIEDPVDRIKYSKLYDDYARGRKSDPGAEVVLQDFAQTSTANPADVLEFNFPMYVSAQDRMALYSRLLSDRKHNITTQRSNAKEYVESMVSMPEGLHKPSKIELEMTNGPNKYLVMEKAVKDQRAFWVSKFNQAIEDSKNNPGEDADMAVIRVKREMLEDMESQGLTKQNVSQVRIPVSALEPIDNLFSQTGGLIGMVRATESGEGFTRGDIQQTFQDATLDIMMKYGLDPMDGNSLAKALAEDPIARREAMRDIYQLNLQKQWLIQHSAPSRIENAE